MKIDNIGDQSEELLVILTINGSVQEITNFSSESLQAMSGLPTWEKSIKGKKENKFNPATQYTQFVYHKLGTPDHKSMVQQIGQPKIKNQNGKRVELWPEHTVEDYIMAQVLSKGWSACNGKMEGTTFTFQSNNLSFNAQWHYGKNKFVIVK